MMVRLLTGRIGDKKSTDQNILLFDVRLDRSFYFTAGQYVKLTIQTEKRKKGYDSRFLSIASSPAEKNLLKFAVTMSGSEFKKRIMSSSGSLSVELEGPRGRFTLHPESSSPAVFITDRIGITPARSIIEDATLKSLPHRIYLFHAESSPEENSLYRDILDLMEKNSRLKVLPIMQASGGEEIECESACDFVKGILKGDFWPAIFYISGTPVNVVSVRNRLMDMGVSPENIRMESFAGY